MKNTINATALQTDLAKVLRRVKRGERLTVLYRSRPAFRIVPVEPPVDERDPEMVASGWFDEPFQGTRPREPHVEPRATPDYRDNPLYGAVGLGRSDPALAHLTDDEIIYGFRKP